MNKLLRADFARLFRKKVFWVEAVLIALLAAFDTVTYYLDSVKYDYFAAGEEILFSGGTYVALLIVILIPSFIGTEYADKTIRNKLIVGHGKDKVFISNMITMLFAGALLMSIWNVVSGVLCAIILGFEKTWTINALYLFEEYIVILTLSALIVAVAMFISSKTASSVIALCAFIVLMIYSISISMRLSAEENITVYYTEEGADVDLDEAYFDETSLAAIKSKLIENTVPNPNYVVEGPYRTYLSVAKNVLVSSQLLDLSGVYEVETIWYVVFDNVMILLLTIGGALIYRRKEIS